VSRLLFAGKKFLGSDGATLVYFCASKLEMVTEDCWWTSHLASARCGFSCSTYSRTYQLANLSIKHVSDNPLWHSLRMDIQLHSTCKINELNTYLKRNIRWGFSPALILARRQFSESQSLFVSICIPLIGVPLDLYSFDSDRSFINDFCWSDLFELLEMQLVMSCIIHVMAGRCSNLQQTPPSNLTKVYALWAYSTHY
jgi:hypothetical protein